MATHTVAFHENVQSTGLQDLAPLGVSEGETFFSVDSDGYKELGGFTQVIAALVGGTSNVVQARYDAPGLREPFQGRYIGPLESAAEPSSPTPLADYRRNPITLQDRNRHALQVDNSDAGAAEDIYAVAWYSDGQTQSPVDASGAIPTRWTADSSFSGTDGQWSSQDYSPDNNLDDEVGPYAIVGAMGISGSAEHVAGRFDIQTGGQGRNKPGFLFYSNPEDDVDARFRLGRWQNFGTIAADESLTVEHFSNGTTSSTPELLLDLVPTGGRRRR